MSRIEKGRKRGVTGGGRVRWGGEGVNPDHRPRKTKGLGIGRRGLARRLKIGDKRAECRVSHILPYPNLAGYFDRIFYRHKNEKTRLITRLKSNV